MKNFLNILLVSAICCFIGTNSVSQELVSKGFLDPIEFTFTGKSNYKTKKTLTHALAYSYSKDLGDIQAAITYPAHYQTIRIEDNGFKTIIRLGPEEIKGHTELLDFDFSDIILPNLKSISLFMYKGSDLVYVKNIADLKSEGESIYFTFRHQRFAGDWKIELKNPVWEFEYNEKEFNSAWEHIANYQIAYDWIEKVRQYNFSEKTEEYILKTRMLQLLESIRKLKFYKYTKDKLLQDPKELQRKIEISIFKYQKDLELLSSQIEQPNYKDFAKSYFSFEKYLIELHQSNNRLYGDLYHEFDTQDTSCFSLSLIDEMVVDSNRKAFDILYQKYTFDLINQLINSQQTPEALFQISRFGTYYKNSEFLSESGIFKHFKARAVYDIYLSYIKVSKQALEHDQIGIAIKYLDKASDIQKNYSTEIINDILVEKEMRNLIKKAMSRYQILLEEGKTDSARKVKEGILGLMKKLGLEENTYPVG